MTDVKSLHRRRHGRAILFTLLALLVGGVMLQWSWNVFAAGLLEAPAMQWRHALAAQLLPAVAFTVAGAASVSVAACPQGARKLPRADRRGAQTIHNPEE